MTLPFLAMIKNAIAKKSDRSVSPGSPPGRALGQRLAIGLRLAAVLAIVLAAFAPPIDLPSRSRAVVYAIDRSASISDADIDRARLAVYEAYPRRGDVKIAVVAFDSVPELVVPLGAPPGQVWITPPFGRSSGSDIAAALRLSAATLPSHGERRIVVYTDGRATRGDALAEVKRLERMGIVVDTVALGGAMSGDTELAGLTPVATEVAEGEPFVVEAALRGVPGAMTTVVWTRDNQPLAASDTVIGPDGTAIARYSDTSAPAGAHVYAARISTSSGDATASTAGFVSGRPRVLVLSAFGDSPTLLAAALSGMEVTVDARTLDSVPPDAAALAETDLVVLADLPLERRGEVSLVAGLSADMQEMLLQYVGERGGGVLALGGAFGFGPEYASTPLARMLPVEIEDLGEVDDPPVALAVMLDRSGSMGAMVGNHTKLELAVEAALAAVSAVRTTDRVAIAAVDTVSSWYQPLAPASEIVRRRDSIRRMQVGGGGIYVYTGLADAYAVLATAPERVRHVILFSDTADSEEQFQGCSYGPCPGGLASAITLAEHARDAGITTSVVGVGEATDSDTGFLRQLAAGGAGRFYLTSTGSDLRRIFVSETRAATRSNLREEPTPLVAGDPHAVVAGVALGAIPPLRGFVQAGRRATADTSIVTSDGKPILASWRYGLGTVVAFTSDAGGRWTSGWAQHEGAMQLMRQLVRSGMRRRGAVAADATLTLGDRMATLEVELPEGEEAQQAPTIELFTITETGETKPLPAAIERVAPGRYRARARTYGEPFALAHVRDGQGRLVTSTIAGLDRASEHAAHGPDERALAELARTGHGIVEPSSADTLRGGAPSRAQPYPSSRPLLLLAALLLCADLAARRFGRPRATRAAAARPQTTSNQAPDQLAA